MPAEAQNDPIPDPELTRLLADFAARISQDWPDIFDTHRHGDAFRGIENLPSKNAFYHDLADVLNARYKARYGLDAASTKEIKPHTIRRLFEEGAHRNYDDKTRDLLAVYLGYANWAAYRMRVVGQETASSHEADKITPSASIFSVPSYGLIAALGLLLLLAGGYYAYREWSDQPDGERLKVLSVSSARAPAKVVVRYDLRGLDYQDVYITCSSVNIVPQREEGVLTFDIILPQYSPVQLYVDGKVVAEVAQNVESDGWEGYLGLHIPLEKSSFYQSGKLQLPYYSSPTTTTQEVYYPAFLNFRDYGLSADAMLFEARVLNNAKVGGQWAHDVSIDLVGTRHRAFFNVLTPDAVIYAHAGVSEVELKGSKNPELKALGYAMDDWCVVAMRVEDKKAVIFINGKEALTINYREPLGDLRGIQFYLKGSGAVDWVRVTDLEENKVKFFDDFLGEKVVP